MNKDPAKKNSPSHINLTVKIGSKQSFNLSKEPLKTSIFSILESLKKLYWNFPEKMEKVKIINDTAKSSLKGKTYHLDHCLHDLVEGPSQK